MERSSDDGGCVLGFIPTMVGELTHRRKLCVQILAKPRSDEVNPLVNLSTGQNDSVPFAPEEANVREEFGHVDDGCGNHVVSFKLRACAHDDEMTPSHVSRSMISSLVLREEMSILA